MKNRRLATAYKKFSQAFGSANYGEDNDRNIKKSVFASLGDVNKVKPFDADKYLNRTVDALKVEPSDLARTLICEHQIICLTLSFNLQDKYGFFSVKDVPDIHRKLRLRTDKIGARLLRELEQQTLVFMTISEWQQRYARQR